MKCMMYFQQAAHIQCAYVLTYLHLQPHVCSYHYQCYYMVSVFVSFSKEGLHASVFELYFTLWRITSKVLHEFLFSFKSVYFNYLVSI